jgi:hypothetical protein
MLWDKAFTQFVSCFATPPIAQQNYLPRVRIGGQNATREGNPK